MKNTVEVDCTIVLDLHHCFRSYLYVQVCALNILYIKMQEGKNKQILQSLDIILPIRYKE